MIFPIKTPLLKVVAIAFIMPLVSCTTYSRYNQTVRNSTSYLNSSPLVSLKAPDGITLPVQNDIYHIPVNRNDSLNKEPDISPPE